MIVGRTFCPATVQLQPIQILFQTIFQQTETVPFGLKIDSKDVIMHYFCRLFKLATS